MLRAQEIAQMDCRALDTAIRQLTKIVTSFFEAFGLFPTSEPVKISAIVVTSEVHKYLCR
jgi:hypothetical protein